MSRMTTTLVLALQLAPQTQETQGAGDCAICWTE
jgi:hypothetical protein